jgi:hypothetical protein
MLPEIRQSDYLYSVPKFELDRNDIFDLACELKGFHENFTDCFLRSESRENFYRYMSGQFNQLERKSIEPIAFSIEGGPRLEQCSALYPMRRGMMSTSCKSIAIW